MKYGLRIGDSKVLKVEVTEKMFAQFDGELVHPTYSTVAMVYHMEWASRDLVLPYLENDEESAGVAVTMKHIAPSALGSKIEVKATVTDISKKFVTTSVTAKNETGIIGEGEVKQAVFTKHTMKNKLEKQIQIMKKKGDHFYGKIGRYKANRKRYI